MLVDRGSVTALDGTNANLPKVVTSIVTGERFSPSSRNASGIIKYIFYASMASFWCRKLFPGANRILLPHPLFGSSLPTFAVDRLAGFHAALVGTVQHVFVNLFSHFICVCLGADPSTSLAAFVGHSNCGIHRLFATAKGRKLLAELQDPNPINHFSPSRLKKKKVC